MTLPRSCGEVERWMKELIIEGRGQGVSSADWHGGLFNLTTLVEAKMVLE